ncbi:MAG: hypothetical protein LT070_11550 [Solirubrobacteraceae bacterium]|nr:hypothetical protein [Solirubrobacteraceae bacterium]
MPFRELHDHEAHRLAAHAPDRLLRYVARARAAGRPDLASRALQLLAWTWEPVVIAMVRAKVADEHVEDVAHEALVRATRSIERAAPQAVNVAQLRGWLKVITARTVADHYAARGPQPIPLAGAYEIASVDGGYDAVDYQELIDRRLARLSTRDRLIVELKVFDGRTAGETAAAIEREIGERPGENAIDQVASRFRQALRGEAGQE